MITASEGTVMVRDAVVADNEALLGVCEACTMDGDIALRIDRRPDFFALNALEGDAWRVGATEDGTGALTGCVAAARRDVWMNGQPRTACYVSDLKVIPSARRGGAADELSRYAAHACHELGGADVPALVTILAGNARMERRASGPRGLPTLRRVATINALAIPLLWERREHVDGYSVRAATAHDLEAMTDLWWHVSARRQFASWFTPDSLHNWIRTAPGLSVGDYLLAHDSRGRLQGFIGVWDQTCLKQLRVVSYSQRLAMMRSFINVVARAIGASALPPAGEALPVLATVHCCASTPSVLRALLLEAYRRRRGGRHALLTIGLDVRDPLMAATRGLLAPPTFVHAYLTSPAGRCDEVLDDRPFHLETALT